MERKDERPGVTSMSAIIWFFCKLIKALRFEQ
jgi:hypothetical protein